MLVWLDGGTSRREKPNENFAREYLELFTLGTGAYSEQDIREAARAFTGWVPEGGSRMPGDCQPELRIRRRGSRLRPPRRSWARPARGRRPTSCGSRSNTPRPRGIWRRLYREFVAEEPEPAPELIEPLADALRSSDYSIGHVMDMILRSRHFYSKASYRHRIKSPVEYTVGLLRELEVPRAKVNLMAAATACTRQGQELIAPPSVKGWEGGTSWINSSTILERLNWATDVVWGNPELGIAPFDPIAWLDYQSVKRDQAADEFREPAASR